MRDQAVQVIDLDTKWQPLLALAAQVGNSRRSAAFPRGLGPAVAEETVQLPIE